MTYEIQIDGKNHRLELNRTAEGGWLCHLDGQKIEGDGVLVQPEILSLRIGDRAYEIRAERIAGELRLWVGSECFTAEVRDPRSLRGRARVLDDHGPKKITAPMPGKVVRVMVQEGSEVEAGTGIAVVEAMKMQNEIKSPKKGTIQKVLVTENTAVNSGDVLAIVE